MRQIMLLLFIGLLLAGAGLRALNAQVNDALLMQKRPARQLSEYGFFKDMAAQIPVDGILPYDLKVSLFTDFAHKYRFVYVPHGQSASYDGEEVFDFPIGTVLIKTFVYPADFRNPDEDVRLIETRLLIHQEAGWNAWTYLWNDAQNDATLKIAGASVPVRWVDQHGVGKSINYQVPNKNQCKGCHSFDKSLSPIGPKARNLNKDYAYDSGSLNQIEKWQMVNFLSGVPDNRDAWPSVPAITDETSDINLRARAYLDVNCSHCHRLEGPASTSGLYLTYGEKSKTHWGYKKRPVAAGRGSAGLAFDIDPGHPEHSIIHFRMHSNDPGIMMPELGRSVTDPAGLALIHEWIESLE